MRKTMTNVFNFCAGPAMLPTAVMEKAQQEFCNWQNMGISVMEMSHRSPEYIKVAKDPLSYIGVNSVGLKRRGYSDEQIRNIENTYKILFVQNKNISNGIEIVKKEIPDCEERQIILDFIANSPNGMIKGFA